MFPMALTVPPPQIAYIKKFLELPESAIEKFLDSLSKAGPQFNTADLADEVSTSLEIPKELVRGMVGVLGSLYLTKEAKDAPTEAFIDQDVSTALKRADTF